MRRYGWKNKTQSNLLTGFYEITCWACKKRNVFIIDPKTLPFHNAKLTKKILRSEFYRAVKCLINS